MNLGKRIEQVLAEDALERATHTVVWNGEVTQATRMRIDALIEKCKEKRMLLKVKKDFDENGIF